VVLSWQMRLATRCTMQVLSRGSLRGSAAGGARLRGRSPWRRPGSGSNRAGFSADHVRAFAVGSPLSRGLSSYAQARLASGPARYAFGIGSQTPTGISSHRIDAQVGELVRAVIP